MDSLDIAALDSKRGKNWIALHGDCVEVARQLPERSIDFSIYSPPFSGIYIYSDSANDMGNNPDDDTFFDQYRFLVGELFRVLRPGRLCAVHCKNLVNYKGRDGEAGLRDFRGDIIRVHREAGFAYHSEVVIWKDPVVEMTRTKAHGLLYKQLRADSTFSRQGMPEYLLIFRRWPKTEQESEYVRSVMHTKEEFPLPQWQKWASPVWMDIQQTNVLNNTLARESKDEKHICPLQLDVILRALVLWSNPNDVVFSPFMGIGSEGFVSVQHKRKFIGTELKKSYFDQACGFLSKAESESETLFDFAIPTP